MVFEAMGLHVFFRQQKLKVPFRTSLLVSMIGMFYSSVTPAATGGQPMQVFSFKKRGVPTGLSSSGLAVKFFCYQTALLALGGGFGGGVRCGEICGAVSGAVSYSGAPVSNSSYSGYSASSSGYSASYSVSAG